MKSRADKPKETKSQTVANTKVPQQTFQFASDGPDGVAHKELQNMVDNSLQVKQLQAYQEMANNSPQIRQTDPLHPSVQSITPVQKQSLAQEPVRQKKENNTGLPDTLKTGMENLSGMSLDDVKVHYNSDKPAQLQAHAYAQGADIHIASGQEKHLPHEAWHVVQQKQGRVKPTIQLKESLAINDDAGLEKEADVMGALAHNQGIAQHNTGQLKTDSDPAQKPAVTERKAALIQRVLTHGWEPGSIVYDAKADDKKYPDTAEIKATELFGKVGRWALKASPELKAVFTEAGREGGWFDFSLKAVGTMGKESTFGVTDCSYSNRRGRIAVEFEFNPSSDANRGREIYALVHELGLHVVPAFKEMQRLRAGGKEAPPPAKDAPDPDHEALHKGTSKEYNEVYPSVLKLLTDSIASMRAKDQGEVRASGVTNASYLAGLEKALAQYRESHDRDILEKAGLQKILIDLERDVPSFIRTQVILDLKAGKSNAKVIELAGKILGFHKNSHAVVHQLWTGLRGLHVFTEETITRYEKILKMMHDEIGVLTPLLPPPA